MVCSQDSETLMLNFFFFFEFLYQMDLEWDLAPFIFVPNKDPLVEGLFLSGLFPTVLQQCNTHFLPSLTLFHLLSH